MDPEQLRDIEAWVTENSVSFFAPIFPDTSPPVYSLSSEIRDIEERVIENADAFYEPVWVEASLNPEELFSEPSHTFAIEETPPQADIETGNARFPRDQNLLQEEMVRLFHLREEGHFSSFYVQNPFRSSPECGTVILNSDETLEPFIKLRKPDGTILFSCHQQGTLLPFRDETFVKVEALSIKAFYRWTRREVSPSIILATKFFIPHVGRSLKELSEIKCSTCRNRVDLVFEHIYCFDHDHPRRYPTFFEIRTLTKFEAIDTFERKLSSFDIWASPCPDSPIVD